MKKNNVPQVLLTRKITIAALSIAVSLVTVSMFRNTSSILSAIIIPIVFSVFLSSFAFKEYALIATIIVLTTLLFVTTQIVFMMIYLIQGKLIILYVFYKKTNEKMWYLIYTIFVSTSLFLGIIITELVFKIPLHTFMMSISNNNLLIYGSIILFEGVIISMLHILVISKLHKRFSNSFYLQ